MEGFVAQQSDAVRKPVIRESPFSLKSLAISRGARIALWSAFLLV